ncbi:MAG: tetratricopeptide repeat protein [Clostridiales bacterium]|nr:tetratricopeptide repeat protein [Clostridiales bacterium]
MRCYYCGASLDFTGSCPECEADVRIWKKICRTSNSFYNDGLEKARVRDLTGSAESLKMSLRCNKANIEARNLLGLVYYEMGETVNALSEWVISKSMVSDDNPASDYLSCVQKSAAQLENINQTIRKFNQSLTYCRQGNYDLAVIQLKKVLSMNPKMVKGHQLLALLYMREERYDLAIRSLRHAEHIDANNTNTLRYMQECREHLKSNGKLKPQKEETETVTYQSGNDVIIRPTKFTDNTAVRTVVNLLIGAAIGVAVVCFLIVPEIRQRVNASAAEQVVEANQTISAKEQTIQNLEDEIASMNEQVTEAESAISSADEKTEAYSQLLNAYVSYAEEDYTTAGELLADVDRDLLGTDEQAIYDSMMEVVESAMLQAAWEEGLSVYASKDYEAAIELFLTVAETDPTYEEGELAYYLAFAYNYLEDYENALKWFNVAAENASKSSTKRTAQSMAEDLESKGYTAAE